MRAWLARRCGASTNCRIKSDFLRRGVAMYCPRCGQQPAYEALRFCPACGLRLDGVAELLASNGAPASLGARQVTGDGPKRLGMRQGAKLMLFRLGSLPLFVVARLFLDSPVAP